MRRDTCRTCDEDIVWAVTTKGSNMPVNADPDPAGNIVLVSEDKGSYSRTVAQVVGPADSVPDDVPRYTSHFAKCGHADVWRNR